jgi:hypothetical protein
MDDDEKAAIDEIANSLQVITLQSTRLRQELGESAQQAIDLEGATASRSRNEAATAGRQEEALASIATHHEGSSENGLAPCLHFSPDTVQRLTCPRRDVLSRERCPDRRDAQAAMGRSSSDPNHPEFRLLEHSRHEGVFGPGAL